MTFACLLIPALIGCSSPETEALPVRALLRQDLPAAVQLLVHSSDPCARIGAGAACDVDRLRVLAQRYQTLEPQRGRVRSAQTEMLRAAVTEALDAGEPGRAAEVLAAALVASPDDARLLGLKRRVEQAASLPSVSAAQRARLYAALAQVPSAERARLLSLAQRAALEDRYSPDNRSINLLHQVGVGREAAARLLRTVDSDYVRVPDWPRASAAAEERLSWLASVWPAQPLDLPDAATVDQALDGLDQALEWADGAGVPRQTVIVEWVGGALGALDPWTRAVWPTEIESWQQDQAGVHQGVGLDLVQGPDGGVIIGGLVLDGPAWTSGLHQGDRLLRVDGHPASPDPEIVRQALRGPAGTTLTLELSRAGRPPFAVTLTRAPITVPTVSGLRRRPDNRWDPWLDRASGLVYVDIDRFKPATLGDFDALTEPLLDQTRGLMLDLRGNPGGDINAAVQIADRFVADGRLAEITGRVLPDTGPEVDPATGEHLAAWNDAIPGHGLEGVPVVVLVDADTASAAEVLAGALQERAGAWVVGSPTWGKGYAQALRTDPQGRYALQLTNLVWTLPSGRRLARELDGGVIPDVRVSLSAGEAYQVRRLHRAQGALRVHADGTPMSWDDPGRRADLPPLEDDPVRVVAELVLRVLVESPGR